MINVYFRTIDENGDTGYFGYASAKNGEDLFWLIDEFIDPHQVQIRNDNGGAGFLTKTKSYKNTSYRSLKNKAEFSGGSWDVAMSQAKWIKPEILGSNIIVPWSKKRG